MDNLVDRMRKMAKIIHIVRKRDIIDTLNAAADGLQRSTEELNEARAERDEVFRENCELLAKIPTEQPDRGGRLLLNAYGRACYRAGQESVAPEHSTMLESQKAALAEARRVLRSCEWAGRDRNGHECCPVCGMVDTMGHDDACAIAAVLAQEEKK